MPVMLAGTVLVLLFYVMAAVISWRLYGVLFLLPQLLLSLLWLQHCHALSQPGHDGGPGEGLGVLMVMAMQAMLIVGGLLAGAAVAAGRRVAGAEIDSPPDGFGGDPMP
ncbi:hypothetical protein [Pseudoxanthomonas sp. z9]|uniref:hypothetical protein n=1 Tax=Pseudoxanthomonas sp. z9 TaxID=2584942 RepID=UPI0011428D9E|nr:hypothetical protein [Pseudoxanthomonas sp. z9]